MFGRRSFCVAGGRITLAKLNEFRRILAELNLRRWLLFDLGSEPTFQALALRDS